MSNKCGLIFNEHKMFVIPAFVKMGVVSAPFGAYFGILYDAAHYGGEVKNERSAKTTILKIITLALCIGPITMPFFYISSGNQVWIQYIFRVSIPFFLAPFSMFAFSKPIFSRFGLTKEI